MADQFSPFKASPKMQTPRSPSLSQTQKIKQFEKGSSSKQQRSSQSPLRSRDLNAMASSSSFACYSTPKKNKSRNKSLNKDRASVVTEVMSAQIQRLKLMHRKLKQEQITLHSELIEFMSQLSKQGYQGFADVSKKAILDKLHEKSDEKFFKLKKEMDEQKRNMSKIIEQKEKQNRDLKLIIQRKNEETNDFKKYLDIKKNEIKSKEKYINMLEKSIEEMKKKHSSELSRVDSAKASLENQYVTQIQQLLQEKQLSKSSIPQLSLSQQTAKDNQRRTSTNRYGKSSPSPLSARNRSKSRNLSPMNEVTSTNVIIAEQQEKEYLQQELESLKKLMNTIRKDRDDQSKIIESKSAIISDLRDKLQKMQEQLDFAHNESYQFMKEIEDQQNQINSLKANNTAQNMDSTLSSGDHQSQKLQHRSNSTTTATSIQDQHHHQNKFILNTEENVDDLSLNYPLDKLISNDTEQPLTDRTHQIVSALTDRTSILNHQEEEFLNTDDYDDFENPLLSKTCKLETRSKSPLQNRKRSFENNSKHSQKYSISPLPQSRKSSGSSSNKINNKSLNSSTNSVHKLTKSFKSKGITTTISQSVLSNTNSNRSIGKVFKEKFSSYLEGILL